MALFGRTAFSGCMLKSYIQLPTQPRQWVNNIVLLYHIAGWLLYKGPMGLAAPCYMTCQATHATPHFAQP